MIADFVCNCLPSISDFLPTSIFFRPLVRRPSSLVLRLPFSPSQLLNCLSFRLAPSIIRPRPKAPPTAPPFDLHCQFPYKLLF